MASAGTAGALAGLLFVAISINLTRIIDMPGVSGRAAESIILLSATLSEALVALFPGLKLWQLALALAIIAVPAWLGPLAMQIASLRRGTFLKPSHIVSRIVLHQAGAMPVVLAAASLWGVLPGGMFWLGAGFITSMLVAICNAWILLVEILR